MATSKPVFVFIPGAWHGPECFEATIELLHKRGYSGQGINLASVGAQMPLENFDADVHIIRRTIEELVATGKNVVVVMHSYAGSPASEAMKYFVDDNAGQNGKGKIIRMAWVCAFIFPEGGSLMKGLGMKDLPWFRVNGGEVNPKGPKTVFYNDLSDAEGERWANTLKPHSYRTFYSEVSVEPWMTIPSAYLLCEKDNAIPIQAQQGMVAMAQGKNPKAFDLVESCESGHSPFLSMPNTLANFLVKCSEGI